MKTLNIAEAGVNHKGDMALARHMINIAAEACRVPKIQRCNAYGPIYHCQQLFGWQPRYGGREGLKRGLTETVDWFARPEHLGRYKPDIYSL